MRERTGHNDGEQILKYQRAVGIAPRVPYCMAAQVWAFIVAARAYLAEQIPILRSGHARSVWNDAVRRGKRTAYIPQVGDLLFWRLGRSYSGHVERIIAVGKAGWVRTVAFNVGGVGSARDGSYGVAIKTRNLIHPIGMLFVLGLVGRSPPLAMNPDYGYSIVQAPGCDSIRGLFACGARL